MDRDHLKKKTKKFSANVMRFVDKIPRTVAGRIIADQLGRSSGSVGANYRAVCRAKSTKDFIFKMFIVQEEADESMFWMEMLIEIGLFKENDLHALLDEADQIVAITVASIKTAGKNSRKNQQSKINKQKSE